MSLKKELACEAARILLCTVEQKIQLLKETYKGDSKIQKTLDQVHDEIFSTEQEDDEESFGHMIEEEIQHVLEEKVMKKKIKTTTKQQ